MALFDLANRVRQFISGEMDTEKKNQAFDSIEKSTGIKIDEKQRIAMIKANVPVDKLMIAYTLQQIQGAASNARASQGITQLQQPNGFEQVQSQMPGGGSISQGGVTANIPPSPLMEQQKSTATEIGKVIAEKKKNTFKAENTSQGTYRFMQQFQKSYDELKSFDPEVDKVGVGGFLSRKAAQIAEHLDELPETKSLKIQVLPLANKMARDIEGGRVTDSDRKIYADSFAAGYMHPTRTNVRLMSYSLINLLDNGGYDKRFMETMGAHLKQLAAMNHPL